MTTSGLIDERLTHSVIGAFYEVSRHLGYGLVERIHAAALEVELRGRGHRVDREVNVGVYYKAIPVGWQRLDMIVDERLIVEVKSSEVLAPAAKRQLLSYLAATRFEVGLLLHFGPKPRFFRLVHTKPVERPT